MVFRRINGYFLSYKMNYPEKTDSCDIKQGSQHFSGARCSILQSVSRNISNLFFPFFF